MSKPVNFFSELPLRRTHRRANVKTWFRWGSVLPFVFPPVVRQVIELVLRAEEGLHRDVVKHLAQAEEKVLESLAWTGDSPLWEELRANEGPLPSCQQVGSKTHKITSATYSGFLQGDRRWRFLSEMKSETWLKRFSWLNDRSEALQFLYTCGFNGGLVSFVGDPLCTTWRSDEDGHATWRKPTRRYGYSLLKGSHK